MYPWHLNVHGSLGFQGSFELDGPIVRTQHKVGLVMALRWLWNSYPYPFSGGVVRLWVQRLDFVDQVEGET